MLELVVEIELLAEVALELVAFVVNGCRASTLGGDWGTGVVVVCVPR